MSNYPRQKSERNDKIKTLHSRGLSLVKLAKMFKITKQRCSQICNGRPPKPKNRRASMHVARDMEIIRDRQSGMLLRNLSKKYNLSVARIHRICAQGLPPR
jgi:Mor family transcriptional regulator